MFYRSEDVFDREIFELISCRKNLSEKFNPEIALKKLSSNNDENIEPKAIDKKTGKSDHTSQAPQFG